MPWLTPIVFKQGPEEPVTRIPLHGDGPREIRFRHVVHVYKDARVPANTAVQSITFESIRQASRFCAPEYPVACVAVAYPSDFDLVPQGVLTGPPLRRFVTDVASFRVPRPLPLLFDILRSGASADIATRSAAGIRSRIADILRGSISGRGRTVRSDEIEYLVLTNSDIHLQPAFYRVLAEFIHQGYDVITVNRRTIEAPGERASSPLFLAERGTDHPGLDCFAFPTCILESFVASECCCGAGYVMRSLLFNLVAHARRFLMLTHAQLTYHLGDDRPWAAAEFSDYLDFNASQAKSVIAALARDPEKAQRLADFINAHEDDIFRQFLSSGSRSDTHHPA